VIVVGEARAAQLLEQVVDVLALAQDVRKGVMAPMSMAMAPSAMACDEMRSSSSLMTRRYSARGGTWRSASFSTAAAQAWLAVMAQT
jgi:hypothetical protein